MTEISEKFKNLLAEVKAYLSITWDDEITDKNVLTSIEEGQAYIDRIIGVPVDFDSDKEAKSLLKDYCRYVRNYALESFEENFLSKILGLQLKYSLNTNKIEEKSDAEENESSNL